MVEDLWDDYHTHIDFEERFGVEFSKCVDLEYFNDILEGFHRVVVTENE